MDTLDRKQLIDCLDREIERMSKDLQRPGWTQWAIMVSFITIAGLALREIDNAKGMSISNVLQGLVVSWMAFDLWGLVRGLLHTRWSDVSTDIRFAWSRFQPHAHRAQLLIECMRYAGFLAIQVWLDGKTPQPARAIEYGWFVCAMAGTAGLLVRSYRDTVIDSYSIASTSIKYRIGVGALYIVILLVLCIGILAHAVHLIQSEQWDVATVRMIGVLFAMFYLISLVYRVSSDGVVVGELVAIRRELAFASSDVDEARREIRCLLFGAGAVDVLRRFVARVFRHVREAKEIAKAVDSQLSTVESRFPVDQEWTCDERGVVAPVIKSCSDMMDRVLKHTKPIKKSVASLEAAKKRMIAMGVEPVGLQGIDTEVSRLIGDLEQAVLPVMTRIDTMRRKCRANVAGGLDSRSRS